MSSKDIEVEIKVKIQKPTALVKYLNKHAKHGKILNQTDTYYIPKHRNFIKVRPAKEWLRLRTANGVNYINYKNWHYEKNGKTNYCDEYETTIEDIKQIEKIFAALDIKKITVVDKKRETWHYKDYEIALDKIKNLGSFVEIEYKGKSNLNPEKITDNMINLLKDIGCGEIQRNFQGYPFLLLFPEEAKYEEQ